MTSPSESSAAILGGEPPPVVSIVTTSFNSARTIERTIDSVHAQGLAVEHIFIDGASRDDTVDIIRRRMRAGDVLVSEPDRGISDAMNKGIARVRAPYVGILHSDDWLAPDQLAKAVEAIEASGADFAYGDVLMHVSDNSAYLERGDPNPERVIGRRMPSVPHPSLLIRKAVFDELGVYREDLRLAMDYEWLLRAIRAGKHGVYSDSIRPNMTFDGASNTQFWRTLGDVRRIVVEYGRSPAIAWCEQLLRYAKTAAGRMVRKRSGGLYLRLRRLMNRQIVGEVAPE